jgi:hypothetical protein
MAVMMVTLNTVTPTLAMIRTHTTNTTTATTIVLIISVLSYCADSNLLRLRCFADFGSTPTQLNLLDAQLFWCFNG